MAKKKMPAGLRKYWQKKRRKAGLRKAQRRRSASNRKPAAIAVRSKKRKRSTMAKRKSTRRSSGRRSGSRKVKTMDIVSAMALGAGGYVLAGAVNRMIPIDDPLMKGGAIALGAALLAPMVPGAMLPAVIGFGTRGVLSAAQTAFPEINGIGEMQPQFSQLTQRDVDALEAALLNGIGDEYQDAVMGYDSRNDAVMGYDSRNDAVMGEEEEEGEYYDAA